MTVIQTEPRTTPSSSAIPLQDRSEEAALSSSGPAVPSLPPLANGVPTSVFGFAIVVLMLSLANTGIIGSGTTFVPIAMVIGFLTIGIGGL